MLINWLSGRATVTLFLTLLLAVVVVGAQQDKPKQNKLNAKTAYLADPSALVGCPSWALCNDPDRCDVFIHPHDCCIVCGRKSSGGAAAAAYGIKHFNSLTSMLLQFLDIQDGVWQL